MEQPRSSHSLSLSNFRKISRRNLLSLLLLLLARGLGLLPLTWRIKLGRMLGFIFSLIPTKDRRLAELQMNIFLKNHGGSLALPSVYANLGQTLFELFNLKPFLKHPEVYISCPDLPFLSSLAAGRQPVIALSAHTGNWDLLAAYLIGQGFHFRTIGKMAQKQSLQSVLSRIRSDYGIKTIWRDQSGGTKEIIRQIKSGGILSALIDQDTTVSSMLVPFFGQPASSPSALVSLGKKFNAAIITVFIFRTEHSHYTIFAAPLDSSRTVSEILTEYNTRLENHLKEYPGQWVWFHKRWRTDPSGRRLSSAEYLNYLEGKLHDQAC